MIEALLLIFSSPATWLRISETPRKWGVLLVSYVIPMLLLAGAAEGYGLVHWGKARGQISKIKPFPLTFTISYETAQLLLSLAVIFLAARLIKSIGGTFHGRHTFSQ